MNERDKIRGEIKSIISKGSFDDGKILIDEFKNNFGNDDEILSMEAIINFYEGNYEKALQNIRIGLRYNVKNSDLYYTMGNVYEETKEINRAFLCYEQALYLCKDEENKEVLDESINKLKENNMVNVKEVSLVILTYNQLDYTKVCIESIRTNNYRNTYEIIVVDNHSTDGTVEWLKEQIDIKVIFNDENRGFPTGCNQGIDIAKKTNDIFLLNNDTIVMVNSIFNMRMALYSQNNVGAVGTVSNSVSYGQQIKEQFFNLDGYLQFSNTNNISDSNRYEERIKLVGFAMMIKRETIDKVGALDERFTPGNFEDDDLSIRIYLSGYKLLLCRDTYIHHFGSISFKEDIVKYNSLINVNKRKFYDKWGFDSLKELMIYEDCQKYINERDNNILEVFCGSGSNLLELSQKFKDKKYYGYNNNKNLISFMKENDFNIIDSLEEKVYEYYYDKIIISDYKKIVDDKKLAKSIANYCNKDNGNILVIMDAFKYGLAELDIEEIVKIKKLFRENNFRVVDEKKYIYGEKIVTNYICLQRKNEKVIDNNLRNMFPLLSVIVNCKEDEIYDVVDSIFNQSYMNIEVVIMSEKINIIENENILYYEINKNITTNENIDRAIRTSNGKYFTVIEDNILGDDGKFKKMMELHQKNDLALVYDGIVEEDEILEGSKASKYIANNIIELSYLKTLGIINKEYHINQYGSYFNKKFEYLRGISTYCSCLKYGFVGVVGKSESYETNQQYILNQLCDSLILIKEIKEERFLTSSNEYIQIIDNILNEIKNITNSNVNKEVNSQIDDLMKQYKINTRGINFYNFGFNSSIENEEEIISPESIDIGNNTLIKEDSNLILPYKNKANHPRIVIGNNCILGKKLFISSVNKVVIEDNCIIDSNVNITDHNQEYRKVGIPIRDQGVTSFTEEITIGAGSWIGNNCVIVGDVKIGRGCVICANSIVTKDIPDYCVAIGNPAKVNKYFDKELGKWIKVDDNWNEEEYNKKISNMKPLLTIGIPTYNRACFLERCLDNIYKQVGNENMVEILVSDNASEDATKKVVEKYKLKHKNLRYNRNSENLGLMGNTRKVYELARGKFITAHGDDDYYSENIIYEILDTIYKNNDSSIIYTLPKLCEYSIQNGYGIDSYVNTMSFMTTFVTGLIMKNDKYKEINNKTKYDGTELDLVYFQMELLKNKEKFTIIQAKIFNNESGQHRQTGNPYNFGKVFIEYYLDILLGYLNNGLKIETLKEEKIKLINNMIIPWVQIISNNQAELAINNLEEIYIKYFKDEQYFEEKLNIIRKILKDKDV